MRRASADVRARSRRTWSTVLCVLLGVAAPAMAPAATPATEGVAASETEAELAGPPIIVAPPAFDFGPVTARTAMVKVLRVANAGESALEVAWTNLAGADTASYHILSGGGPFSVEPGAERMLQLMFAPSEAGAKSAVLAIGSNDPDTPVASVLLTGVGLPAPTPAIAISPAIGDFGLVPIHFEAMMRFSIINTGSFFLNVATTTITGPDAADFRVALGGAPFSVYACGQPPPCLTHRLEIAFAPQTPGSKVATLEITSNDPAVPLLVVALSGRGTEASDP